MVTPDEMGRDGYRWGEPGTPFGTRYWDQDGRVVTDNLEGDDSRVIVDRAVPFMEKGVDNDTMVWFCSDNGPEGSEDLAGNGRNRGTTGGLRGRKRSLFNGGIGVPSLLKWPARVAAGAEYHMPCSTLDYFPTIASALGYTMPDPRPLDGASLLPLIDGQTRQRPRPSHESAPLRLHLVLPAHPRRRRLPRPLHPRQRLPGDHGNLEMRQTVP